jgi:hypothetical protein
MGAFGEHGEIGLRVTLQRTYHIENPGQDMVMVMVMVWVMGMVWEMMRCIVDSL